MSKTDPVTVCDGKYTFFLDSDGLLNCDRHGEPWPAFRETGSHYSGATLALYQALAEERRGHEDRGAGTFAGKPRAPCSDQYPGCLRPMGHMGPHGMRDGRDYEDEERWCARCDVRLLTYEEELCAACFPARKKPDRVGFEA